MLATNFLNLKHCMSSKTCQNSRSIPPATSVRSLGQSLYLLPLKKKKTKPIVVSYVFCDKLTFTSICLKFTCLSCYILKYVVKHSFFPFKSRLLGRPYKKNFPASWQNQKGKSMMTYLINLKRLLKKKVLNATSGMILRRTAWYVICILWCQPHSFI